jgi:hypothetical protein
LAEGLFCDFFQSILACERDNGEKILNCSELMQHHYDVRPIFLTRAIPGINRVSPLIQGFKSGNLTGCFGTKWGMAHVAKIERQPSGWTCAYCDENLKRPGILQQTGQNFLFGLVPWAQNLVICGLCSNAMNNHVRAGTLHKLVQLGSEEAFRDYRKKRQGKGGNHSELVENSPGLDGRSCPLCDGAFTFSASGGTKASHQPGYPNSPEKLSIPCLAGIEAICYTCARAVDRIKNPMHPDDYLKKFWTYAQTDALTFETLKDILKKKSKQGFLKQWVEQNLSK